MVKRKKTITSKKGSRNEEPTTTNVQASSSSSPKPESIPNQDQDENRSISSNDTGKFLRECWKEWGAFIDSIEKLEINSECPPQVKKPSQANEDYKKIRVMDLDKTIVKANTDESVKEKIEQSTDNKFNDKVENIVKDTEQTKDGTGVKLTKISSEKCLPEERPGTSE